MTWNEGTGQFPSAMKRESETSNTDGYGRATGLWIAGLSKTAYATDWHG